MRVAMIKITYDPKQGADTIEDFDIMGDLSLSADSGEDVEIISDEEVPE